MTANVKCIPMKFDGIGEVEGYQFSRLYKSKKAYMYSVTYTDFIHYEVFSRKVNLISNTEDYPNKHHFGKTAFTYMDLEKAKEKYNKLKNGKTKDIK